MTYKFYMIMGKDGDYLVGKEYSNFAVELSKTLNSLSGVTEISIPGLDMKGVYEFEDGTKIYAPHFKDSHDKKKENKFYAENNGRGNLDKTISRIEKELGNKYKFEEVKIKWQKR